MTEFVGYRVTCTLTSGVVHGTVKELDISNMNHQKMTLVDGLFKTN